ncbi:probable helicase senataxin [Spodoptera litura]|uniref:Probable helicase senataxin n=1 Tax=Spodoptera litura TaxID=69820 RepID=A0A9J7IVL7_SPOLT|nr:probable helicase senataxin [Spodoptera litura]
MAKWKLTRQQFGAEEFTLSEGDTVTVGRGNNNNITLSSAVISRNHCVIHVHNNRALLTDLQSSNGVYVGSIKIPPNTPYVIQDSDVIGLGWTMAAPLVNINDTEKYVFKFIKEKPGHSITSKIKFQGDNDDDIESRVAMLDAIVKEEKPFIATETNKSPVLNNKIPQKRKIEKNKIAVKQEPKSNDIDNINDIPNIVLSDSENESVQPLNQGAKKPKLEPVFEEQQKQTSKDAYINMKNENENEVEFAFNVKQEYIGYDEPIQIDDSDSDSESEHWLMRLSQSSPGKPFLKSPKNNKTENSQEDSYSQLDDFLCDDYENEDVLDDLISLPIIPPNQELKEIPDEVASSKVQEHPQESNGDVDSEELFEDVLAKQTSSKATNEDEIDSYNIEELFKEVDSILKSPLLGDSLKKARLIEPIALSSKNKPSRLVVEVKPKKSSAKHTKQKTSTTSKPHISYSQKEERKKKLKEIACKNKETEARKSKDTVGDSKPVATNVKITTTNRGAFLTDDSKAVASQVNRKEHNRSKEKSVNSSPKAKEGKNKDATEDVENKRRDPDNLDKSKDKSKSSKHKDRSKTEHKADKCSSNPSVKETRVPLKSLKPLTDSEESISGKPISKVGPMKPDKSKKKVRFSENAPQVLVFEIEPGNKMKKTSLVKTTLVDVRQSPVFSLEKITLMKILRWNPQWLEEQLNNNDPPPILGHNKIPMSVFHSFVNHNQYVQLVGDLLLMEIWECLTIAYMKIRNQNVGLEMRVESLPPIPPQERCLELFNLSVNISVPAAEAKFKVPRVGEVLLVTFGPENAKNQRFFYVHNVRNLPSPSSNRRAFFSVSLHATFADKLKSLKPGELMIGRSLAFINKELQLFEAMEHLAGSPLSDAILRPEPHHFTKTQEVQPLINTQWTTTLNPSQLAAVSSSVAAALSDRPSIQMVQGPPGTGKSSVICAIVMTYFYNAQGKKQQNRGKLLICATSNAAVDGLVVRLLNLRQSLPKPERFRMVRVGREEAMHPEAANICSQQLAKRDVARIHSEQPTAPSGLNEEILHVEAKINMWKTQEKDAKDPSRVAYCQGRVADLEKRMALLRSGGGRGGAGDTLSSEQFAQVERRIIDGADIIVTTLGSAQSYKMRGLKRRIALCIIDEAGQVIEPETLIPLTLDVTRLTLIGDPQQLPGFICSQRAKQHGLNESLFSRLSSCSEHWAGGSPVVLLNQQYRMHPDIADYPSRAFYNGRVMNVPPVRPSLPIPPYNIVGISSGDKAQGVNGANEMEAWGVTRLVLALSQALRSAGMRIAVITPYNGHKDLIKRHLKTLNLSESQVEVNTVDSFQGQERDVVVVSLARSQGVGFLTDAGRMNVMLTRARHAMLICLNPHALLKNLQWRTLVEDAQRRNMYKVLPHKMCQPITAAQLPNDNILDYITYKKHSNHSNR